MRSISLIWGGKGTFFFSAIVCEERTKLRKIERKRKEVKRRERKRSFDTRTEERKIFRTDTLLKTDIPVHF